MKSDSVRSENHKKINEVDDVLDFFELFDSYKKALLTTARIKPSKDSSGYYGEIPSCPGVWAEGPVEKIVERELESALTAWLCLRFATDQSIPSTNEINKAD